MRTVTLSIASRQAVTRRALQALSGAGHPGVASLDGLGNVIPHIGGEEEKIEAEPGDYDKEIEPAGELCCSTAVRTLSRRSSISAHSPLRDASCESACSCMRLRR